MKNRLRKLWMAFNYLVRCVWPFFVKLSDLAVFFGFASMIYWVAIILFDDATTIEDKRSLLIGSIGLVLSALTVYVATIRPFFEKPRVKLIFNEQWSESTETDGSGSWFYRLKVENYGLIRAKNCVGRLIGVWTEEGDQIIKFDPLPLYWARQNSYEDESTYRPIDIQGYRDFDFLDLAQVSDNIIKLRVVIRPPMKLPYGQDTSVSPGSEPVLRLPGTYYARIGLYADNFSFSPIVVKMTCSNSSQTLSSKSGLCELKKVKRLPRKRDGG